MLSQHRASSLNVKNSSEINIRENSMMLCFEYCQLLVTSDVMNCQISWVHAQDIRGNNFKLYINLDIGQIYNIKSTLTKVHVVRDSFSDNRGYSRYIVFAGPLSSMQTLENESSDNPLSVSLLEKLFRNCTETKLMFCWQGKHCSKICLGQGYRVI